MPDTSEDGPAAPKVNILLVDDQPANLLTLRSILTGLGQNLVEANSSDEAMRLLRTDDFVLVLLDVHMQGVDALDMARLIRSEEKSRHTPIIFHTAGQSNRLPIEEEAYSLGGVDYLIKLLVWTVMKSPNEYMRRRLSSRPT